MAMNEYGEIVRQEGKGMKQQELGSGIRKLTQKERYAYLVKQVSDVKHELRTANTEETVNGALNRLEDLIDTLSYDRQLAALKGWVADLSGTIRGVKLHDITRSKLVEMLEELLKRANEIIAEEAKKENVNKLKALFLELAEHAEEIANVIDIDKIFG